MSWLAKITSYEICFPFQHAEVNGNGLLVYRRHQLCYSYSYYYSFPGEKKVVIDCSLYEHIYSVQYILDSSGSQLNNKNYHTFTLFLVSKSGSLNPFLIHARNFMSQKTF